MFCLTVEVVLGHSWQVFDKLSRYNENQDIARKKGPNEGLPVLDMPIPMKSGLYDSLYILNMHRGPRDLPEK